MKSIIFNSILRVVLFVGTYMLCGIVGVNAQVYEEGSGRTIYPQKDGGVVVYTPTGGGTVTACKGGADYCDEFDCSKQPKECRDALEAADEGLEKSTADLSGGKKIKTDMVLLKEVKQLVELYPRRRMFVEKESGKFEPVKEWKRRHETLKNRFRD
jgi:hypothetical protein